MIVSLCPVLFGDHLLINADDSKSKFDYLSRRISRTATLDGGCFILDNGFTASDGTITIVINANHNTPALRQRLIYLIKQFGDYTLSNRHGFFICSLDSIYDENGGLKLSLLVKEQVI